MTLDENLQAGRPSVAVVVVTHHPDAGVADRLALLADQADWLIVVDNASSPPVLERLRDWARARGQGVDVLANSRNMGIAAALNQGVALARSHGAAWALTMDQDTQAEPDLIDRLCRLIAGSSGDTSRWGVLAANYVDSTGQVHDRSRLQADGTHAVRTAITSGSLVHIAAWQAVHGFNDALFIDSVDHDFCLRLRKAGWAVRLTDQPMMRHALGRPWRVNLGLVRPAVSNHSPTRRYYMTRNRVAMFKAHGGFEPVWCAQELVRMGAEAILTLTCESGRLAKLRAMGIGAWHGLCGRLGPWQG